LAPAWISRRPRSPHRYRDTVPVVEI